MRPSLLAAALCLATSSTALASQPFALELRGGASVLSGPESFRLYYLGDNDSLPPLIAPTTGLPYDRWYSASTMLGTRWALPPQLLRLPSGARALLSASLGQNIYTPRTAMIAPAFVTGQPLPAEVGWGQIETRPGLAADASLFAETTLASLDGTPPSWMEWSGGHPSLHWMAGASGHAGSMLLAGAAHTALTAGWTGDPLARDPAFIPFAAYVSLRGELRRVGYNATIDGPILDGAVVARHQPWVGEVAFGAVLRAWRLEASVGPVYRTNEVATLRNDLRVGQLIWQASASYVQ